MAYPQRSQISQNSSLNDFEVLREYERAITSKMQFYQENGVQVGSQECQESVLVAICLELYPICSASRARASCSLSCDKWKLHVGSSCACSDAEECPSLLQQVADVCPLSEGQTLFTSSRVQCQRLSAGECAGYTWMHTHTHHIHMHPYTLTPTCMHVHMCTHRCAYCSHTLPPHTHTNTDTHTHTNTLKHTHTHTRTWTHTDTHTHARMHAHTHEHRHTRIQTHTHTHGHRHRQLCTLELYLDTYLDSLQRVLLCVHTHTYVCVCVLPCSPVRTLLAWCASAGT